MPENKTKKAGRKPSKSAAPRRDIYEAPANHKLADLKPGNVISWQSIPHLVRGVEIVDGGAAVSLSRLDRERPIPTARKELSFKRGAYEDYVFTTRPLSPKLKVLKFADRKPAG